MIFAFSASALAEPVVYLDETAFLDALAGLGYTPVHEGFEDDATWGDVRGSAQAAAAVSSQGLTWTSNNLTSNITTGVGPARSQASMDSTLIPHGSYANPDPGTDCLVPGDCGDGFRGRANDAIATNCHWWLGRH